MARTGLRFAADLATLHLQGALQGSRSERPEPTLNTGAPDAVSVRRGNKPDKG